LQTVPANATFAVFSYDKKNGDYAKTVYYFVFPKSAANRKEFSAIDALKKHFKSIALIAQLGER
jgi:hypothetical protein